MNPIDIPNKKRSIEGALKRKKNKKRKQLKNRNQAHLLLMDERRRNEEIEHRLATEKKKNEDLQKKISCNGLSSVSRSLLVGKVSKTCFNNLLPSCTELSGNVIECFGKKLGEGTFGLVKEGFFKTVSLKCAIKSGKQNLFDAKIECRILQFLQGSPFFPYPFGIFDNKLVMELLVNTDGKVMTIQNQKTNPDIDVEMWRSICKDLSKALYFLHSRSLLHNDIKINNIVLEYDSEMKLFPK